MLGSRLCFCASRPSTSEPLEARKIVWVGVPRSSIGLGRANTTRRVSEGHSARQVGVPRSSIGLGRANTTRRVSEGHSARQVGVPRSSIGLGLVPTSPF